MFKKLFWFTDIHFGRSANNPVALQDNLDFLDWAIDRAKSWGADTCIMGGDWHDNRISIGVETIIYSLKGLEKLNNAFDKIIFLPGNHDLLYRDKRDIASIEFAKYLDKIEIIRNPITTDDITFLPWLVGNEHEMIKSIKSRYVFGHLEMPGFMMNSNVVLPDNDFMANADDFKDNEFVFTGHFHLRQHRNRIVYTGNVMPFNFSDVDDDQRGIMLLEWGKDPIFEKWKEQPLYTSVALSQLLENPSQFLRQKMTVKIAIDCVITHEESQELKNELITGFGLRKVEMIKQKLEEHADQEFKANTSVKTVDQIVIEGINTIDSSDIDVKKLNKIYQSIMN